MPARSHGRGVGAQLGTDRLDRPLLSLPLRSASPETLARSAGMDATQIGDEPDSRIVRLPASYTPASTRTCAAALRASAPRL